MGVGSQRNGSVRGTVGQQNNILIYDLVNSYASLLCEIFNYLG